jgi:hypothetical protein
VHTPPTRLKLGLGPQSHTKLDVQSSHCGHGPEHLPPHPSLAPQAAPVQLGVQQPEPDWHVPLQPSLCPQSFPVHDGVQQPEPDWHVAKQPSLCPQTFPVHDGVQQPEPDWHVPPQPSPCPHSTPLQVGTQSAQVPELQSVLCIVQSAHGQPLLPQAVSLIPSLHV